MQNSVPMMGTEENATNGGSVGGEAGACECAHGSGDSGEEELSVLPRHTKVVVTGNNRTKSVLVGLQGVVKKAVGLGGWHWLVLTNGIEVKLQRNALSVIEAPTGQEEEYDNDREYENVQCNVSDMASDDVQKPQKPRHRPHKIVVPVPKNTCRSRSCDSKTKGSVFPANVRMKVDLSKLETATLWRYWRHYNLGGGICPDTSKEQLVDAVKRHFMSQVIAGFIRAAKRLKNIYN